MVLAEAAAPVTRGGSYSKYIASGHEVVERFLLYRVYLHGGHDAVVYQRQFPANVLPNPAKAVRAIWYFAAPRARNAFDFVALQPIPKNSLLNHNLYFPMAIFKTFSTEIPGFQGGG